MVIDFQGFYIQHPALTSSIVSVYQLYTFVKGGISLLSNHEIFIDIFHDLFSRRGR
jgi:hypothetical protein